MDIQGGNDRNWVIESKGVQKKINHVCFAWVGSRRFDKFFFAIRGKELNTPENNKMVFDALQDSSLVNEGAKFVLHEGNGTDGVKNCKHPHIEVQLPMGEPGWRIFRIVKYVAKGITYSENSSGRILEFLKEGASWDEAVGLARFYNGYNYPPMVAISKETFGEFLRTKKMIDCTKEAALSRKESTEPWVISDDFQHFGASAPDLPAGINLQDRNTWKPLHDNKFDYRAGQGTVKEELKKFREEMAK